MLHIFNLKVNKDSFQAHLLSFFLIEVICRLNTMSVLYVLCVTSVLAITGANKPEYIANRETLCFLRSLFMQQDT